MTERREASAPPMPPRVSVIICAWTMLRWSQLERAVASALDQEPEPVEVLVVVDHEPELLRRATEVLARVARCPVRILDNTGVRGLSAARNVGVDRSCGDVVAFLDDDAAAHPGWLHQHARHYTDPDVCGVGGQVEPRWAQERPSWFPMEFGWVVGCSWNGLPTTTAPVRNPIGANMSFRRSAVVAVGGFDERLGRVGAGGAGAEETALAIDLTMTGYGHVLYEPQARVDHDVSAERARLAYFRDRCRAEGASKAILARTRPGAALATESAYVRTVLLRGVCRETARAARGDAEASFARAWVILAGLVLTAEGFVRGSWRLHRDEDLS